MVKHEVREELQGVGWFLGTLWMVWLLDSVLQLDFTRWGIVPRTVSGLVGIPIAPFLHAGIGHLLSNTIPLAILLVLMAGSRTRTWATVAEIILLGGILLWIIGRPVTHVGASGLIYGLIAFLIVSGFREMRVVPLGVAILVGFLYGGTLISGVLPSMDQRISWDGHLCGALAGAGLGYFGTLQAERNPENPTPQ